MKRTFNFKSAIGTVLHAALRVALPLVVLILVSQGLKELAFASVLLFKWRVLAVKSRFWLANLRANMVDVLVGLSIVEFMSSVTLAPRIAWAVAFVVWVLFIKKLSGYKGMITQGVVAFAVAYSALLQGYSDVNFGLLLAAVWFVSYFSARHILSAFSEEYSPSLAHIWALFSIQLFWVLWHFQINYFFVEQAVLLPTLVLLAISTTYAMSKQAEPNKAYIRQILITSSVMALALIVLSNWRQDITV